MDWTRSVVGCVLTSLIQASVHDAVFDLHVAGEVSLQRELAGAVKTFEGFAVRVQMHVAHQVVHPVELLPTKLRGKKKDESNDSDKQYSIMNPW